MQMAAGCLSQARLTGQGASPPIRSTSRSGLGVDVDIAIPVIVCQADARHIPLPDESVQCVVSSPPYWNLRSYGIGTDNGEIGLEPTPELYVEHLVEVFREVRRVCRHDATVWVNLGDSFQDKQLVGIPWRVAFALQADGWWLRSDIVWHKPNPMPESVTDRPTKAHEYLFLLTKSARYYWDQEAVREQALWNNPEALKINAQARQKARLMERGAICVQQEVGGYHFVGPRDGKGRNSIGKGEQTLSMNPAGRNIRSVWTIATTPFSGAHFATMPPDLVEPCIKAGSSERGACPQCQAPWERVVEIGKVTSTGGSKTGARARNMKTISPLGQDPTKSAYNTGEMNAHEHHTLGWRPTCSCDAGEPVPCMCLDPFGGSGTVGLVAMQLGRRALLVELSESYCHEIAWPRLHPGVTNFVEGEPLEALPMFAK